MNLRQYNPKASVTFLHFGNWNLKIGVMLTQIGSALTQIGLVLTQWILVQSVYNRQALHLYRPKKKNKHTLGCCRFLLRLSLSKSHILGFQAVYLQIIYVYLVLTQWVRSCVRRRSSQAAFLSAAAAGSLTCATRIEPPKCSEWEKKVQRNGRALRGGLLCMDGRSSSWPSSLIGRCYISRALPVHLKKNTESVYKDAQSSSVWREYSASLRLKRWF